MRTVDQMYQLPKRSEAYSNLQSVLENAMYGLEFCAPLTGENQQTVQMADLDGDGEQEYLVFTKGSSELPLRILVLNRVKNEFFHMDTIESNGAAFDRVEYIQMDKNPGVELVIGRQISNQLVRSVSVYTFAAGQAQLLMSTNYRGFTAVDLDQNGLSELFVLRPGQEETKNGVAELYRVQSGVMERSNEVEMAAPADKIKRILVGGLYDEKPAVYVASSVENVSLITDVFTEKSGLLINVSRAGDSDIGTQTLRNYYVYGDDIDNDGVVELPHLMRMVRLEDVPTAEQRNLIRWYAFKSDGSTVDKLYTYYDSVGGWYLVLDEILAPRISVRCLGNTYEFYLWNVGYSRAQKLMTIHMLTGQNREEQSVADGRFVLLKTDTVIYSASLENVAADYRVTQNSLVQSFSLIHRDWNMGEM